MAQTNVNIRMDTQLKKQFEDFCSNVGLTMSTAFNIFAKTSVRQQKIPFEITTAADNYYSESCMKNLLEGVKQLNAGKVVEHNLTGA